MHPVRLIRAALVGGMLLAAPPVAAQAPSDHNVRRRVSEQGFDNIYLNVRNDERIQVRATRGQWVYLLQVSTCTGDIIYGQRLRPA